MARKIPIALANANDEIAYLKRKIGKLEVQLKPCNNKQESFYETLVIITHEVSIQTEKYDLLYNGLDQGMYGPWNLFIEWAKEFEEATKKIEWGINGGEDYIDTLWNFIEMKLNKELDMDIPDYKKQPNGNTKVQKRGTNAKKVR